MKKILFALLLLSSSTIFAQNVRVRTQLNTNAPSSVQLSFQKEYPNVKNAQWHHRNNQWHATYRDNNNRDIDSYYDRHGQRMDTHTSWNTTEVPVVVTKRITNNYHPAGNYKVVRIEPRNNQPLFQIHIQHGRRNRTVYMDERGTRRHYYDRH